MNSQQWKNVLDQLDDDIVDSAAERFNGADAAEEHSAFQEDNKPREYKNNSSRKRFGGLFIGLGSVAAAAAVTGIVLVRNLPTGQEVTPLSEGAELKAVSSVSSTAIEIQEPVALVSSYTATERLEVMPSAFTSDDFALFDKYFNGYWTNENSSIMLDYSAGSPFGDDYTCTGIERISNGCYMAAQDGSQYDLWYVSPEDNSGMMYIYRNVSLTDGMIQYNDDGTISCGSTESFRLSSASPDKYNTLGYFGKLKLAYDLGMTPEALYTQVELDTYAGTDSGEAHWLRSDGGYSSPWDKVVLKEQNDSSIVMSMAFSMQDQPESITYFDLYWVPTDGETWALDNVRRSNDLFVWTAQDLRESLTLSDLDIFEMYYSGKWSAGSDEITLSYSQDIFTPNNICGGFYAGDDGLFMFDLITVPESAEEAYTQVYFIPYDDPFTMYMYEPDIFGYAMQDNYLAMYSHTDSSLDELDTVRMSWLGLQRWILDTDGASGEGTLSKAVYSAFTDIGNADINVNNYNGSGDPFEGYVIEELSSGKYRLTFQLFDKENKSQWVSVVLQLIDNNWEVLPVDGITTDTEG